jgi:hypothetical protein
MLLTFIAYFFMTRYIRECDYSVFPLYEGYRPPDLVWEHNLSSLNPRDNRYTMTGLKECNTTTFESQFNSSRDELIMILINYFNKVDASLKNLTSLNIGINDKLVLIDSEKMIVNAVGILSGEVIDHCE